MEVEVEASATDALSSPPWAKGGRGGEAQANACSCVGIGGVAVGV